MKTITKIIAGAMAILTLSGCAHYNNRYDSYPDYGYSSGYGSYGSYGNYRYPAYGGGGGYYGNYNNYPSYRTQQQHHHHHDRRPPAPGYWGSSRPNNGYYSNHSNYYQQNNYYNRPQPRPNQTPGFWGNNNRPPQGHQHQHDGNWQARHDHDDRRPLNGNQWQGRNGQPLAPPSNAPRFQTPRPNPPPQFTNAPNRPWAGQRSQLNNPQPNRGNWQGRNNPPPQPRPQVIATPRPPASNPQFNRGNWQARTNPPPPRAQPIVNQTNRAPAPQRMPGGRQNRQWNGLSR